MYKWAANQIKLQRAIAESKGGDEETIKSLYISYGGLINKGYETVSEKTDELQEVIETPSEVPDLSKDGDMSIEKTPMRRGRPKKNVE